MVSQHLARHRSCRSTWLRLLSGSSSFINFACRLKRCNALVILLYGKSCPACSSELLQKVRHTINTSHTEENKRFTWLLLLEWEDYAVQRRCFWSNNCSSTMQFRGQLGTTPPKLLRFCATLARQTNVSLFRECQSSDLFRY